MDEYKSAAISIFNLLVRMIRSPSEASKASIFSIAADARGFMERLSQESEFYEMAKQLKDQWDDNRELAEQILLDDEKFESFVKSEVNELEDAGVSEQGRAFLITDLYQSRSFLRGRTYDLAGVNRSLGESASLLAGYQPPPPGDEPPSEDDQMFVIGVAKSIGGAIIIIVDAGIGEPVIGTLSGAWGCSILNRGAKDMGITKK